jgi:PKD repeat protein
VLRLLLAIAPVSLLVACGTDRVTNTVTPPMPSPAPIVTQDGSSGTPAALACNFVVQAPSGFRSGVAILFESRAVHTAGTIQRYEWSFSDGLVVDRANVAHVFSAPGSYRVTHVVTDASGAQGSCQAALSIS